VRVAGIVEAAEGAARGVNSRDYVALQLAAFAPEAVIRVSAKFAYRAPYSRHCSDTASKHRLTVV
jgi:hypothetical protein